MGRETINKQMGTKWFTFYTKVRPCLACLSTFSLVVDFIQYANVYVSNWWLILYLLSGILGLILAVMVLVRSCGDYVDFVRFVKGVLLYEVFTTPYRIGVEQYIESHFSFGYACTVFAIVLVLEYFVWYRLNIRYFEKRILPIPDVLTAEEEDENKDEIPLYPSAHTEVERVCFCRKCGENLLEGSEFCRMCGTPISIERERVLINEEKSKD